MRSCSFVLRSFAIFLLLFSLALQRPGLAQDSDKESAPFGLKWGMSSAAVRALGVDLKDEKGSDFGVSFAATTLPKMLNDASAVYLAFGFDDRLWRVAAISRTFDNDPYGSAVLARYDELSRILAEKYGQGKQQHNLDRMWSKPNEFLMGITTGQSRWYVDYESQAVFVQLGILARTMSSASWRLIYENKPLRAAFNAGKRTNEKGAL